MPGARGVAGVKRVGCWARRDTRGKRGYDGALLREYGGAVWRGDGGDEWVVRAARMMWWDG